MGRAPPRRRGRGPVHGELSSAGFDEIGGHRSLRLRCPSELGGSREIQRPDRQNGLARKARLFSVRCGDCALRRRVRHGLGLWNWPGIGLMGDVVLRRPNREGSLGTGGLPGFPNARVVPAPRRSRGSGRRHRRRPGGHRIRGAVRRIALGRHQIPRNHGRAALGSPPTRSRLLRPSSDRLPEFAEVVHLPGDGRQRRLRPKGKPVPGGLHFHRSLRGRVADRKVRRADRKAPLGACALQGRRRHRAPDRDRGQWQRGRCRRRIGESLSAVDQVQRRERSNILGTPPRRRHRNLTRFRRRRTGRHHRIHLGLESRAAQNLEHLEVRWPIGRKTLDAVRRVFRCRFLLAQLCCDRLRRKRHGFHEWHSPLRHRRTHGVAGGQLLG